MTIDEIIAVLTAYKEGKTIEVGCCGEWNELKEPRFDFTGAYGYRIKPGPCYRPFESAEEIMEAIKEKGQYLMHIFPKGYYHISCIFPERPELVNSPLRIRINGKTHTSEDMMIYYEWADGTPFGKLVEE